MTTHSAPDGDAGPTERAERAFRLLTSPQGLTAPAGRAPAGMPRTPSPRPGQPLNLTAHDLTDSWRQELAEFVGHAAEPERPGPGTADLYAAAREATPHLAPERQDALAAVTWRQAAEAELNPALATYDPDHRVVRSQPCPDCGTWGLLWDTARQEAVCIHTRCAGSSRSGQHRTWTLARLATAAVRKTARRRAT